MAAAEVLGPTGVKTWIEQRRDMTVEQLRDTAVERLPRVQGQSAEDVQVILRGQPLDKSTPLSRCSFIPGDVFHLALRVHGD